LVGDSVEELQLAHLTKIPMLLKNVNNQVPRDLARLIDRGLAKEVGFRPTMRDFRLVLHEIIMGNAPDLTDTQETAPVSEVPTTPAPPEAPKLALGRAPKPESKTNVKNPPKPEKPQGLLGKLFGKK
jgi:eukaryotic-like serine/threonine-protein kinase